MAIDTELWISNYLISKSEKHISTVPISSGRKTDLLDWYDKDNEKKVIDARKYYNRAYHYMKIGSLEPVPEFLVIISDVSPRLVVDLLQDSEVENCATSDDSGTTKVFMKLHLKIQG